MSKKETAAAAETATKTVIAVDRTKYQKVRNAAGKKSLNNGDAVATGLEGLDLDTVYDVTAAVAGVERGELSGKYQHLNAGQQRMNLGNRLRGVVARMNKEKEGTGDKALEKACAPHQKALAEKRKADEKAKAAAEKEAAKSKKDAA